MKGKIAVIESCSKCPYRGFATEMGILIDRTTKQCQEVFSEEAYCCYPGGIYDNTISHLRIEKCIDNYTVHCCCPLPNGNDKSKNKLYKRKRLSKLKLYIYTLKDYWMDKYYVC